MTTRQPHGDESAGRSGAPDEATRWLASTLDLLGPYAVRAAASLKLADLIAAGHTAADDLAREAGTAPGATARLLRYLAARGVFRESAPGHFVLTPAAELLRSDNPKGLHEHLDATGTSGRMERAYPHLIDAVRSGSPVYGNTGGDAPDFYADVDGDSERAAAFAEAMGRQTADTAAALADAYDFGAFGTVVDVGGGNGTLLRTLLSRHPGLKGTALDLPGTADVARGLLAEAGLGDRGTAVGGSYFDPLPAADVYILSSILLDLENDDALRVLRNCASAGTPGSRVVCVEWLAGGEGPPYARTHVDLHELVLTGGRLRDRKELDELAEEAGLTAGLSTLLPTGHLVLEYRLT
ncbi:methyltransferase [Streptomyces sp. OfavH-34-F]|uniref:methyltransferase n=1 Tax=Streptomyces sp. OfavH-34-F TaxID=2917760 RepID=UPI001EF2D989|nr:methyltransferase [Streptomyces sp. OfavH-34-F]MCG7526709.1 methyltransferase [Streptomyces sp. OfavH-34-F]